jgi:hypothetical protein
MAQRCNNCGLIAANEAVTCQSCGINLTYTPPLVVPVKKNITLNSSKGVKPVITSQRVTLPDYYAWAEKVPYSRDCNCPACYSNYTIRFVVAHHHGFTQGTPRSVTWIPNTAVAISAGYSIHQTNVAQLTAPPPKPFIEPKRSPLFVIATTLIIVGFGLINGESGAVKLLGITMIVSSGCLYKYVQKQETNLNKEDKHRLAQWQLAMQYWERLWLCQRCGASFLV